MHLSSSRRLLFYQRLLMLCPECPNRWRRRLCTRPTRCCVRLWALLVQKLSVALHRAAAAQSPGVGPWLPGPGLFRCWPGYTRLTPKLSAVTTSKNVQNSVSCSLTARPLPMARLCCPNLRCGGGPRDGIRDSDGYTLWILILSSSIKQ